MKKYLYSIACAALLSTFAQAQSPTEKLVADLKAKSGQTLQNPVLFARYGNGAFDWLVVSSDGKFAAKLDGMNPDGTFKYTILGDPAKHGLSFDVSLQGVTIHSLSPAPTQSASIKTKTAKSAISAVITGVASDLGTQMMGGLQTRSFAKKSSLADMTLHWAAKYIGHYGKDLSTDACPAGGTIEASGNYTEATVVFHSCYIDANTKLDGSISLQKSGSGYYGTYRNFAIDSAQYQLSLPSATIELDLDSSMHLTHYTLSFTTSTILDKNRNLTYSFKNFYQEVSLGSNLAQIKTDTLFKASCQSEWTTIQTLTPIKVFFNRPCPVAGDVLAKNSKADVKIHINGDSSIDVIDNQNGENIVHYTDCKEAGQDNICQE